MDDSNSGVQQSWSQSCGSSENRMQRIAADLFSRTNQFLANPPVLDSSMDQLKKKQMLPVAELIGEQVSAILKTSRDFEQRVDEFQRRLNNAPTRPGVITLETQDSTADGSPTVPGNSPCEGGKNVCGTGSACTTQLELDFDDTRSAGTSESHSR